MYSEHNIPFAMLFTNQQYSHFIAKGCVISSFMLPSRSLICIDDQLEGVICAFELKCSFETPHIAVAGVKHGLQIKNVLQSIGCLYIIVVHEVDLCKLGVFVRQGTQTSHFMADLPLDFETWIPYRLAYFMASKAGHAESTVVLPRVL